MIGFYSRILFSVLCFLPVFSARAGESLSPFSNQSNSVDEVSARAAAIGSSFLTAEDDAGVLFTNPAGLSSLSRGQLTVNTHFWLVDTFQESFLIGFPGPAPLGSFALAGSYLNFGSFEGRDDIGSLSSTYSADRMALRVGWGLEILPEFSIGMGFQGFQTRLENKNYFTLASDFGVLFEPVEKLRLGAAFDNLGWVSQTGSLTGAFHIGGSYDFNLSATSGLMAAVDGMIQPGSLNYLQGGLEYRYHSRLFLRVGYQQPLSDNKISGLTALTAGVGLALADLTFDYAFQPYGDLGNSHRISLGYRFGNSDHVLDPAAQKKIPESTEKVEPKPIGDTVDKGSLVVEFDLPSDSIAQGMELESQGKFRDATQFYQESIKKNRKDASAWWALGDLYRRFKMKDYAVSCFDQVVKLQPGNQKMSDWLEKYKAAKP